MLRYFIFISSYKVSTFNNIENEHGLFFISTFERNIRSGRITDKCFYFLLWDPLLEASAAVSATAGTAAAMIS